MTIFFWSTGSMKFLIYLLKFNYIFFFFFFEKLNPSLVLWFDQIDVIYLLIHKADISKIINFPVLNIVSFWNMSPKHKKLSQNTTIARSEWRNEGQKRAFFGKGHDQIIKDDFSQVSTHFLWGLKFY